MKVIYCLRRLPHLTHEEFQRHWLEVHGPLVRAHRHALRIERYVQFHTDPDPFLDVLRAFRNSPEPYDGVAEIWYESFGALKGLGRDPVARAASRVILEDERKFVDSARSPIWFGREHTIVAEEGCQPLPFDFVFRHLP
jgi:hypothetical protein